MKWIDFSRSFLTFRIDLDRQPPVTLSKPSPYRVNNARVMLECSCELTDRRAGSTTRYVLGASCKTELVGVERDVWTQPNADMCVVASSEEFMILKSWQRNDMGVMRHPPTLGPQPERQVGAVSEAWVRFAIDVGFAEGRVLETPEQIIEATFANRPLLARIEYDQGDYHICIDHPIKTINVNERDGIYQTDTGPILLPDLRTERMRSGARLVSAFDMAYAAFNGAGWAEFIINARTPLESGASVNHYSQARRIDGTRNQIIQIDGPIA
jgi:hypothetical protein